MNDIKKYVFTKMCSFVNVKFEDINFDNDGWYLEHTWTQKKEKEFCEWLINEIRTNNEVRKELTTLPYRPSKKRVESTVMWFNLMWGWKTEEL